MIKVCEYCKKKFKTNKSHTYQKFCCESCRRKAYRLRIDVKRKEKEYKLGYRKNNKDKMKEMDKRWHRSSYLKNGRVIRARNLKWRKNNSEKVKQMRLDYITLNTKKRKTSQKLYREKNKDKIQKYFVDRYSSNINFNIATKIRRRIYMAIRRQFTLKSYKTVSLLGCSFEVLKKHIGALFTYGMTWDKLLSGKIHIDHIKSCASFDLSNNKQQKECFNYKNLQPLWAKDNIIKNAKVA